MIECQSENASQPKLVRFTLTTILLYYLKGFIYRSSAMTL